MGCIISKRVLSALLQMKDISHDPLKILKFGACNLFGFLFSN